VYGFGLVQPVAQWRSGLQRPAVGLREEDAPRLVGIVPEFRIADLPGDVDAQAVDLVDQRVEALEPDEGVVIDLDLQVVLDDSLQPGQGGGLAQRLLVVRIDAVDATRRPTGSDRPAIER